MTGQVMTGNDKTENVQRGHTHTRTHEIIQEML